MAAGPDAFGLPYPTLRRVLVVAGVALLGLVAGVMYVRRVDEVEVFAVLLFVPVFLAFAFFKLPGGIAVGVAAAFAYVVLRLPSIEVLGWGELAGVIASRAVAYVAFGAAGGWAAANLERSFEKLELYDHVDDVSGLFNARFFVQDTELEMARSKRYSTLFSVAVVDVPEAALATLPRRRRVSFIRDLSRQLGEGVRTVDRAVHAFDGARHRFAVVLPETSADGARVFTERLAARVEDELRRAGVDAAAVGRDWTTFPEDDEKLAALRAEFAWIDRAEHPEAPAADAGA